MSKACQIGGRQTVTKEATERIAPTFMLDIPAPEVLQIQISSDGKIVWINTENGCVFRACRIKQLDLQDDRFAMEEETK